VMWSREIASNYDDLHCTTVAEGEGGGR
jgi:hypothetical protein